MARRKNTKRIDPRYFLNETIYRDIDENLYRQAQPETRAEIALTWALTQRASNWAGQELTIDHFVDLFSFCCRSLSKIATPIGQKTIYGRRCS